jgi:protein tyrosine phosphatase (PTP) superfamily phosphohydrolase (DUF442 family)
MAIDISRSKAVYCLRWAGSEQRRLSTPFGIEHVRAVVEHYRGCQLHVAYEACGFGYELAWWLQDHGVAASVIAPSRVERAPGLAVKTDRVDVGKLARKLETGDLKAIYIPSRTVHEQRQIGRTYAQSLKERKRAQVRIRSLMQEQGRLGPLPAAGWTAYSVWLDAQPLPEPVRLCVQAHQQLRAVAAEGFKVVINLALHNDPRYSLPDEAGLVDSLGLTYVHIPVQFGAPTEGDLLAFFDAMEAHRDSKVSVHCAANKRVTVFLGLYRVVKQKWKSEKAFSLMK